MKKQTIIYNIYSPPGDTLGEILDERKISRAEFSKDSGLSLEMIHKILNGTCAITKEIAITLEKVLGTPESFWLAREANYQAYQAKKENK